MKESGPGAVRWLLLPVRLVLAILRPLWPLSWPTLKYYEEIDRAAAADPAPHHQPQRPFDINALKGRSAMARAVSGVRRRVMLVLFTFFRAVWPNPRFGRLILVTREADVRAVLKDSAFEVPFGREMRQLTGGADFMLGLDGCPHARQRSVVVDHATAIQEAVRPADVGEIVKHARGVSHALLDGAGGRIDVVRDLILRVFTETNARYFGLDLDEPDAFADRAMAMTALLFADPFGNKETRRLALDGSVWLRHMVDRAIARARKYPRDAMIDRLAAYVDPDGATLSDGEIRAIVLGMVTGFVPTSTLAAGKILDELVDRPKWLQKAIEFAHLAEAEKATTGSGSKARQSLHDILLEAARLNPALAPGQFRYARRPGVIPGASRWSRRKVREGQVLLVCTMSAMRDRRAFKRPTSFEPDRHPRSELMLGHGPHECLGKYLAMELITEIFQAVLSRKNIAVAPDAGGMKWVGPFPRRLDMVFDVDSDWRQQTMISVCAPLRAGCSKDELEPRIRALGNPARADIETALKRLELVHFMSLSVIEGDEPENSRPYLILELNVDGPQNTALQKEHVLKKFAAATREWLGPIFQHARGTPDGRAVDLTQGDALADVLAHHVVNLHTKPWGPIGLNFNGTPDSSVADIENQEKLARFARHAVDDFLQGSIGLGSRAMSALAHVRSFLSADRRGDWQMRLPDLPESRRLQVQALLKESEGLETMMLRPRRRRLTISEWLERSFAESWRLVAQSPEVRTAALLVGLLAGLVGASIYWSMETDPDVGPALATFFGGTIVATLVVALFPSLRYLLMRIKADLVASLDRILLLVLLAIPFGLYFMATWLLGWIWPEWVTYGWVGRTAIVIASMFLLMVAGGFVGHAFKEAMPFLLRRWWWGVLLLAVGLIYFNQHDIWFVGRVAAAITGGIGGAIVLVVLVAGVLVAMLRYHEQTDEPDDKNPTMRDLERLAATEDHPGYAHTHLTAVTPLKAGWFRKLTLAAALWGIGTRLRYWYRPGFVSDMGTIHYAKWFRLPGTEKLIFLSNFDGSWESYLEDFITKVHQGQTAAWCHGVGFPRTRFLLLEGAQDGDRFKRWVRRQQVPTQFWFSRFPRLTTEQIRKNALIHDGLMRAASDTAARAWLDSFGTLPRSDKVLETEEVQSLVFRGLRDLEFTTTIMLHFNEHEIGDCKDWLQDLVPNDRMRDIRQAHAPLPDQLTFGDNPIRKGQSEQPATFIAFSAAGLAKLGLPPEDSDATAAAGKVADLHAGLASFPGPFVTGMANRSRVLGDYGSSGPQGWRWTDSAQRDGGSSQADRAVDAILFIYGHSAAVCEAAFRKHEKKLGSAAKVAHRIDTQPASRDRPYREHFGFVDGISNPVIRGSERFTRGVLEGDVVEPGELILGYPSNQGYFPPSLTVRPETDIENRLATDVRGFGSHFPRFGAAQGSDLRDFGRNGTFVAVRQLVQHVEEFHAFAERKAEALNKRYKGLATVAGGPVDREWVEAKMMGRWHDGVSLIARPNVGAVPQDLSGDPASDLKPDNDFSFGKDDPQGLRCPFGAHVRRVNPRDSLRPGDPRQIQNTNRHRMLRRGRSYQIPNAEKGMLFVAICADLERQFEFVQQSWVASPAFHGLVKEPDPIAATESPPMAADDPKRQDRVFTIPTPSGSVILENMQSFVTVSGGGYFFMPSRSAIQYLIDIPPAADGPPSPGAASRTVEQLAVETVS
jgi:Dyp-type peroxidase family